MSEGPAGLKQGAPAAAGLVEGLAEGLAKDKDVAARFRAEFELVPDEILMNSAGVSPLCRPALEAIERASRLLRRGWFALDEVFAGYERARATYARLCGARPEDVAMFHTCAAAISQVALGLPLRPGDEIVLWDQEYPSNAHPWFAAARRSGARVQLVPSEPDLTLRQERLHAAITPRTRVVAVSWVQYATGAMTDLAALGRACRAAGAWLVVDAIQGLGVRPFDLVELGADAVCGGGHKWLCGPLGHGFLALAPGRAAQLEPMQYGAMTYGGPAGLTHAVYDPGLGDRPPWPDARRFEPGSPLLLGGLAGAAATELCLELGPERLGAAARHVAARLVEGVLARGARVLSPLPLASSIVTFIPRGGPEALAAAARALRGHKVAFSERGGGLRLAPHAFNTDEEVDRILAVLDAAAGGHAG